MLIYATSLIMFCTANFMPAHFKSINFHQNKPKIDYFSKNTKFLSAGGSAPRPPKLPIADFWLRARIYSCFCTINFCATRILPDIGVASGGPGGPAPSHNRNASNDKLVRKKVIVASDFLGGL